MSSTRFTQQHIIELNEKPASSLLMNKELQNIYKGTNELDDEAKIHRAKQADPTLADTATEKHVTNAQTKKWEDTANTFSGVSPSSFVAATEVVTTATANKILKLNADSKLPTSITGDADTVDGKHAAAFQEVSQKDQPGGYAGLDATGKIPGELLNITDPVWGSISGTLANQTDLQSALDGKQSVSQKDQPGGYAGLDENGKVANAIQADKVGEKLAADVVIKNDLNAPGDAPMYVCRAWANFDGTPTSPTIRVSGNVSSITRIATGKYTINFDIGMIDENYAVSFISGGYMHSIGTSTTSSIGVGVKDAAGNDANSKDCKVAVFR